MSKPLKTRLTIGLLLDDSLDSQDGVQQYVLTLGRWLDHLGHRVHYLVGQSQRTDLANLHSLAKVLRLNFNRNRIGTPLPAKTHQLTSLINDCQFDVVHVQSPHSPLLAGKLIKLLPKKTVVVSSLHVLPAGPLADFGLRLLGHLSRSSLRRVDQFIANTQATADFFDSRWQTSAVLIPNPINCQQFANPKPHPAYQANKLNLVFLGRLVKRKGILNLIEALHLLPESVLKQIYVHLGGGGQLMATAQAKLKQYHLSDTCRLYGRIAESDKASFLAMADIAIFPSTGGESFGISLLEAMTVGRGVVLAGRNPGYQSVFAAQPKLLFDAQDPQAIAKSLQTWITASSCQRASIRRALEEQVKDYDIELSVGPKILALYQGLLQARATGV